MWVKTARVSNELSAWPSGGCQPGCGDRRPATRHPAAAVGGRLRRTVPTPTHDLPTTAPSSRPEPAPTASHTLAVGVARRRGNSGPD